MYAEEGSQEDASEKKSLLSASVLLLNRIFPSIIFGVENSPRLGFEGKQRSLAG